MLKSHCSKFRIITAKFIECPNFLDFYGRMFSGCDGKRRSRLQSKSSKQKKIGI